MSYFREQLHRDIDMVVDIKRTKISFIVSRSLSNPITSPIDVKQDEKTSLLLLPMIMSKMDVMILKKLVAKGGLYFHCSIYYNNLGRNRGNNFLKNFPLKFQNKVPTYHFKTQTSILKRGSNYGFKHTNRPSTLRQKLSLPTL